MIHTNEISFMAIWTAIQDNSYNTEAINEQVCEMSFRDDKKQKNYSPIFVHLGQKRQSSQT